MYTLIVEETQLIKDNLLILLKNHGLFEIIWADRDPQEGYYVTPLMFGEWEIGHGNCIKENRDLNNESISQFILRHLPSDPKKIVTCKLHLL